MELDKLQLKFSFPGTSTYTDFNQFVADNGSHSRLDFENNGHFCIYFPSMNKTLLLKDQMGISSYWFPFNRDNKAFKIYETVTAFYEHEYILEFKCEGLRYYRISEAIDKHWLEKKIISCNIALVKNGIVVEENIKLTSSDPFWRPKRIEIGDFYNGCGN